MYRKQLLLDLYRQERAVLAAAYTREQARKSTEALNSLHRPSHISAYSSETSKHLPDCREHLGTLVWSPDAAELRCQI